VKGGGWLDGLQNQVLHAVASRRVNTAVGLLRSGHSVERTFDIQEAIEPEMSPSKMALRVNQLADISLQSTCRYYKVHSASSVRTVENHRNNICAKVGVNGSHALIKFALQHQSSL
jgi:hypothetical protein